jgi:hypothetical protein
MTIDVHPSMREDQCLAQEGMVKVVQDVSYKHIEELAREDRQARIAVESEEVEWLMSRLRLRKSSVL